MCDDCESKDREIRRLRAVSLANEALTHRLPIEAARRARDEYRLEIAQQLAACAKIWLDDYSANVPETYKGERSESYARYYAYANAAEQMVFTGAISPFILRRDLYPVTD